ncbi:MAG: hypothetical protein M3N08_02580 [Pseudomonadota bacterium]|nr:hypothetical protein [Pseudomonadota bacterium]
MSFLPQAANNDEPLVIGREPNQKVLEWLNRFSRSDLSFDLLTTSFDRRHKVSVGEASGSPLLDDWQTIGSLCGHSVNDLIAAGAALPLTAAEIDHFRRNHRGTESHVSRDFLTARTDLPSPLAELFGLYQHRARVDAEATLFVAQATGSTRVARVMADLLAIGGFASGLEYISYLGLTYSVPAAFDTSDVIDRANHEAARRLALPVDHPAYLLKLTPDEIGVLASNIAEKHAMPASEFLDKANLLAEARQDVTRLPVSQHFAAAIIERDLPTHQVWVTRLCAAYARIFESWVSGLPAIEAVLQ